MDELELWQEDDEPLTVDLAAIRAGSEALDRKVRRRNILEIGVGVVMLPLLGMALVDVDVPLARLGLLILVAAVVLVIAKLWTGGRRPLPDPSADSATWLAGSRAYLEHQIRLLRTVPLWYAGPIVLGCSVFTTGLSVEGGELSSLPAYLAAYVLVGLGVVALNVRAARALERELAALPPAEPREDAEEPEAGRGDREEVAESGRRVPDKSWLILLLIQLPYWVLVLGRKIGLLAKHLPGLGPVAFLDALWPQLLALTAVALIGYVGVVSNRRFLVAGAVAQVFLIVLLCVMQSPLLYGMDQSGSAVRWTLAAWWLQWNEVAADGSWYMTQRYIAVACVTGLTVFLGAMGPNRARALGAAALAVVCLLLSATGPLGSTVPRYLAQDALVYVYLSDLDIEEKWQRMRDRPVHPGIQEIGPPERPLNIAVVFLESVGHGATSLAADGPPTTPFLEELAGRSLVADEAYVVVPSTYKAHIAALCGVEPYFTGDREIYDAPFDFDCLPELLGAHGYDTAYFTSSSREALGWAHLTKHMGYATFLGHEDMDTTGFEWANMWAYEDDIMLAPSRAWLEERTGPFLTTYMACAPHYEYLATTRYGQRAYVADEQHNRYLNAVHYTDRFVENLIDQYEALGLADDTIFVIVGDHGEGFGEHVPRQHNAVPYEEVLRVPLLVHLPGEWPEGHVADGLRSQLDITPTLATLLQSSLAEGSVQGQSLLGSPHERLYTSCLYTHTCGAVHTPERKFVHHFGDRADELFDLSQDPRETRPLDERARSEQLRGDFLDWYAGGL